MPPRKIKPAKKLVQKAAKAPKKPVTSKKAAVTVKGPAKAKPTGKTPAPAKAPGKAAIKTPAKPVPKAAAQAAPASSPKPIAKKPANAAAKRPKKPVPKAKAPPVPKPINLPRSRGAVRPAAAPTPGNSPAPTPLSVREQKGVLRREMKDAVLKLRERTRRSRDLCDAIVSHPSWRRSIIVAIFAPMEIEPDVELLWKHAEGKTVCYPTIRMGGLDFISVSGPESVSVGQFGIREPVFDQARVIPPDTFDLVLVPGAGFTANGDRLGRGGGFYDRLLASPGFRAFKVGVCFNRQVHDTLPLEPHDQRVHRVVTESGWLQRPDFVRAGKPNA